MLLSASSLEKSFGDNLLFRDVAFSVEQGDIIGLIGGNGCGKTTLFRIISGEELPDGGGVVRKSGVTVGVLNQHACFGSQKTAYNETLSVFGDLLRLEKEIEDVNRELQTVTSDSLISRQHMLQEEFERKGGLTFRARTRSALVGLGLSDEEQALSVAVLSGGQRSKVELCKLLLSEPDVMLLDEPTNHLDIDAIEWLDGYIKATKAAVMIISHDRYFLDRVANRIFELSGQRLHSCDGNYTKYCRVRDERRLTVQRNYDNTMREVERIEKIIVQQKQWNREKNIKTAENKQKMIDRMLADLEIPESEKQNMTLSFTAGSRSGDEVLEAKGLSTKFDERTLYRDVSLKVRRGDRIFIIGPNGCGKTTLLRQLLDKTKVSYGVGVKAGYFDQHQRDLGLKNTIFGELREAYPSLGDATLRGALALFLFKGDEVFREIGTLSGGERARVVLCKLMLRHDNLLFLDEPTNHLDLESREILEDALADYDGTLICVSHDRYFINRLASTVMYFENGEVKIIDGGYDAYVEQRVLPETVKEKKANSENKNLYLKRKEDAANLRKLKTAFSRVEKEIERCEAELGVINEQLSDPVISTDYIKVAELTEKAAELEAALEAFMLEWEEIGAELEGAE